MMDENLVKHWSDALFQIAKEDEQVDEYLNIANSLIGVFGEYPEFLEIVANTSLDNTTRETIILTTFKTELPEFFLNFFLLLMHKGHFRSTRYILKIFRKQCNEFQNLYYGVVYSVVGLSDDQMNNIKTKIDEITQHNNTLINKIDKELIGGIKIKIQNRVIDGSIRGRLDELRQDLLKKKAGSS